MVFGGKWLETSLPYSSLYPQRYVQMRARLRPSGREGSAPLELRALGLDGERGGDLSGFSTETKYLESVF